MRIIAVSTLKEYWERHPDSRQPLSEWYVKVGRAQWESFADMKKDFNSVDYVGNQHYVFNIKGNNHRLVVAVKFTPKIVYIRFVGTHEEYEKIDVKNI
jgi:Uncharacterized protein conserved in bacteria